MPRNAPDCELTKPNNSANNGTAIVWEQRRWELLYWCILEDRIIAWQTSLYYRNCQYWSTVLAQYGLTTENNNSTQHNMNLFFVQICSKLKTQDSPLVLYYRNFQYWSTVLAQDGLTTVKKNSTQRNMNLFFVQNRSKMKTQDSPLVLYLPPTKMNIGNDFGRNEVQNEKDSIYGWWTRDCINSVQSSSKTLRANPSGYHSTTYTYKYMIAESTWKLYGVQVEVP